MALGLGLFCLLGGAGEPVRAANRTPTAPPLPPLSPAPLEFFRNLLATNEAGRAAFLAGKAPAQRELLKQKLSEYLALPAEERELRLALTDLRYYLVIFLRWPANLRAETLHQVPEKYRNLIEERLKIWDNLAPETQQQFLQNEAALAYLIRLSKSTPPTAPSFGGNLPAEHRREIETALTMWQAIPPGQRQALVARFNQFFDLTDQEKKQTLAVLPEEQRLKQAKILAAFARLPKEDREKCSASFDKFLALPPAEREVFLHNAARWVAMSAAERQAVRELVQKFPPLPPGLLDPQAAKVTAMPTNRLRMQ